jgi:RNA-binding protein
MSKLELSIPERQMLRGQAHGLKPVVMIGGDGLTPAVLKEAELAIAAHGLIKIRVFSDDRDSRNAMFETLADTLGAAPVQHIGKLLVLWRPILVKEKIVTAEQKRLRPREVKIVSAPKSATRRAKVKTVTIFGNERVTKGGTIKRAKVRQQSSKRG